MEHDWTTDKESKHVDYKVSKVIVHDGYRSDSNDHDIALLRLDADGGVDLGEDTGITTVCLPAAGTCFENGGPIESAGRGTAVVPTGRDGFDCAAPVVRREEFRRLPGHSRRLGVPESGRFGVEGVEGGERADHEQPAMREDGTRQGTHHGQHDVCRILGG